MELTPLQVKELNRLVDKYEKRRDYASEGKSPRRTMLVLDKQKYPDYYHGSDSSFRLAFNRDMEELATMGLVEVEWVRFNRGNLLKRVILVEKALPLIYSLIKRKSKKEEYAGLTKLFGSWQGKSHPALAPFFQDMLCRLQKLMPLPPQVKLNDVKGYEDLFIGLKAFFDHRPQEVLKRQLSVNHFGDSKRWDELERSILWVIRAYCLSEEETNLEDETILSEQNIITNIRHINLSGPLIFTTPRGRVAVTAFYPDLGLSPVTLEDMKIEDCPASAVVTVENLTSFYQYIFAGPKDHLIIYLGGYHNRPRRLILNKLWDYFTGKGHTVPFMHWGDMDLGGFQIWKHLCQSTGIPVKPLYMDTKAYLAHLSQGQPMKDVYTAKLSRLLEDPFYLPFHPLINLMLEKKVRVEQEAIKI